MLALPHLRHSYIMCEIAGDDPSLQHIFKPPPPFDANVMRQKYCKLAGILLVFVGSLHKSFCKSCLCYL